MYTRIVVLSLISVVLSVPALAQLSPSAAWAAEAEAQYRMSSNVPYVTEGGQEMLLDIYFRRDVDTPQPTLVFYHGGFWVAGNKENSLPALLPWLEMGWNVVNVEYRLGGEALAPAAVVDSFCALRFVSAQAEQYNIDTSRIVVSGQSAGGHLALSMGMIPESEGFADACPDGETPEVAAVINWFGVTDVPDVIDGENRSNAAARWFGDMPNPLPLARRLSPLTYVRDDLPPILTIQGDADNVVPYPEGVALHEALAGTNVPNQMLTIPGGGHGGFSADERNLIYATIQEFLEGIGF
jgi:acetyl esterase/lipase